MSAVNASPPQAVVGRILVVDDHPIVVAGYCQLINHQRELEAFDLIGHGLTTREIAARMHVSPKTVDRHRENIKRKLNLNNTIKLVHHATLWVERNS